MKALDPTLTVELSTTVDPDTEADSRLRTIKLPPPVAKEYRDRVRLPLVGRARMVGFGLAGLLVAIGARLLALAADISALRDGSGEQSPGRVPLDTAADLALAARIGLAVFGAITAIAFIAWLRRARGNWATQGRPRFRPYWAILMWFVPFLNLWRPPQFVADLFAERPGMRRIANTDAWLIALWWIPGVIGVLGQVGLRAWIEVNSADLAAGISPADQNDWHYLAFGTYVLMVISVIGAFFIVNALTKRHAPLR